MKTLILLQNAWAKDKRSAEWMAADRRHWLYATARSRSGQRLKRLFGSECFIDPKLHFDNTTPEIGIGSSSQIPSDPEHVRQVIDAVDPWLIVACGTQAEVVAMGLLPKRLLCIPHPASRVLTNELLGYARGLHSQLEHYDGRFALRQEREGVRLVDLETGESRQVVWRAKAAG